MKRGQNTQQRWEKRGDDTNGNVDEYARTEYKNRNNNETLDIKTGE